MTSRELTEAIDKLITLKIEQHLFYNAPRYNEEIEVTKRAIADAFKELDHRPGVAAYPQKDQAMKQTRCPKCWALIVDATGCPNRCQPL